MERWAGVARRRRLQRLPGAPLCSITVFNSTVDNLARSVIDRLVFHTVAGQVEEIGEPDERVFNRRMLLFRRRLEMHLPSTIPWSRDQFVASYRGDRRWALYRNAADSLLVDALSHRDAKLRTFVKVEKTPVWNTFAMFRDCTKRVSVPRPIQPRSPRFNVEFGRFFRPFEPMLYRAIDLARRDRGQEEPCVMKGHNAAERAQILRRAWLRLRNPVAFKADAHRFDGHVSRTALRWSHSIYKKKLMPGSGYDRRFLAKLCAAKEVNRGSGVCADGKVSYRLVGKRASGDMDTSGGNGLISAGLWDAYCDARNVPAFIFSDGDDVIIMMEGRYAEQFLDHPDRWFLEMGFVMKIDGPMREFEQIEFCQCRPVEVEAGVWLMVRNPVFAVAKDHHSQVVWQNEGELRAWLAAVGTGGEALAGDVPVYGALYKCYLREGHGAAPRMPTGDELNRAMQAMLHSQHRRRFAPPTDTARVSFYAAFGITPTEQVALEQWYYSKTVDWPPVENHCSAGDAGYLSGCARESWA